LSAPLHPLSASARCAAANTGSGGYLIAWQDRRNGPTWDIYAYVQP
jgi:hypothetical protein